jgi:hypothetical protein
MLDHVDMENYDYVILRSATPRAAGAYIENVWASLTAKQKNSVAAAYFGISKNEFMRGKSKPKAAGRSRPIFPKPVIEMLAVVDSFHDFNKHLNLQDLVRDKIIFEKASDSKGIKVCWAPSVVSESGLWLRPRPEIFYCASRRQCKYRKCNRCTTPICCGSARKTIDTV